MLRRLITSLNWLIGTLALGGAVLFPFVDQALLTGSARTGLKNLAEMVVREQGRYYELRNRYVFFTAKETEMTRAGQELGVAFASGDFLVEAMANARNALVVRVYTAPAALAAGRVPPLMYTIDVAQPGESGTGRWAPLSGQKAGLLAALGLS